MTREEAIECNKNLRMYMKLSDKNQPCKFLEENYIALDMAINALEQEPCTLEALELEPCDDCISKIDEVLRILKDVPDTNVGKWIPVSEGLPKTNERVLICSDKGNVMESKFVHYVDSGYSWAVSRFMALDEVVAWMPLPEPYEEVEE